MNRLEAVFFSLSVGRPGTARHPGHDPAGSPPRSPSGGRCERSASGSGSIRHLAALFLALLAAAPLAQAREEGADVSAHMPVQLGSALSAGLTNMFPQDLVLDPRGRPVFAGVSLPDLERLPEVLAAPEAREADDRARDLLARLKKAAGADAVEAELRQGQGRTIVLALRPDPGFGPCPPCDQHLETLARIIGQGNLDVHVVEVVLTP